MARMLCPLAIVVLLALLSSSGCASWRNRQQPDSGNTGSSASGSDGSTLESLANTSLHNWDFRHYWP
jgi:uncharacterized protein YceK